MHKLVIAVVVSITSAVFTADGAAAPGDLDPTFGVGGVARIDIGVFDDASDLAIQPDRKIVAVGTVSHPGGGRNVYVVRLLKDGSVDPGFGTGGMVVPERYHQVAPRVALQPDGKIVLATRGETDGGSAFLYRFGNDGTPDVTFGTAGTATLLPPAGAYVSSIVAGLSIVTDGKILVVLWVNTQEPNIAFARFNADGTPDRSFGTGGFVVVPGFRFPFGFAVQPDGLILVVGAAFLPGRFYSDAFVARFHADGSLDTSFDMDGIALVQLPSTGTDFQAVAPAPDGSIFAGGREFGDNPYESRWLLAKFASGGVRDPAFGSTGLVSYEPGQGGDAIRDLLVQPVGLYAAGSIPGSTRGLPVALFREDGQFDPAFGVGGLTGTPDPSAYGAAPRIAVQTGGKVVALGSIQSWEPTFNQDLYLARYEGNCPPVTVHLDLAPHALNPRSQGRWISATLEPEPPALPADIDPASILFEGAVPIDPSAPLELGDADMDGRPDLSVKFDRRAVERTVTDGPEVRVAVEGEIGGGCFEATDIIRVIGTRTLWPNSDGAGVELALEGAIPNPSTQLSASFSLPDAGPATLVGYDVRGRMVVHREVGGLGPGRHVVQLRRRGELPPGIYHLNLIHGDRRLVSRAVVVR